MLPRGDNGSLTALDSIVASRKAVAILPRGYNRSLKAPDFSVASREAVAMLPRNYNVSLKVLDSSVASQGGGYASEGPLGGGCSDGSSNV